MISNNKPLVSVVTPVYNGGAYIQQCIESVLTQMYSNWEYIIVNNASTDSTFEIAERYSKSDKRIRIHNNERLLDIITNHNKAFQLISPESKYCKVVSGDDWIFPECLVRMVEVAEANPSVGIVGSYQLSGTGTNWRDWGIKWTAVPYPSTVISGREICRLQMLGGPYVFGTPTSTLYRADLVRSNKSFYPNLTAEADTSACYKHLAETDFGFVHQVLSYERVHQLQISSTCRTIQSYKSSLLSDLVEYGPFYLTTEELSRRVKEVLLDYYQFLALSSFARRDKAFWAFHNRRLAELGYPVSKVKLGAAVIRKYLGLLLTPKGTIQKALERLKGA